MYVHLYLLAFLDSFWNLSAIILLRETLIHHVFFFPTGCDAAKEIIDILHI